jgi:hypothetical protein
MWWWWRVGCVAVACVRRCAQVLRAITPIERSVPAVAAAAAGQAVKGPQRRAARRRAVHAAQGGALFMLTGWLPVWVRAWHTALVRCLGATQRVRSLRAAEFLPRMAGACVHACRRSPTSPTSPAPRVHYCLFGLLGCSHRP